MSGVQRAVLVPEQMTSLCLWISNWIQVKASSVHLPGCLHLLIFSLWLCIFWFCLYFRSFRKPDQKTFICLHIRATSAFGWGVMHLLGATVHRQF